MTVQTPAERLGVLVKQTQAVLHQRMDEALQPIGLSVPQYVCLQTLADTPGITGSELARRVFVSRQSMSVLLQGLERKGLVERASDPGPRRERTTSLTAAGRDLVPDARRRVAVVADRMTGGLDNDALAQLETSLRACRDALLG